MSLDKIGKLEAISLILVVMINGIVLNIPNIIILQTKTGSVINVIFISILAVIFTIIICKLFQPFYGKDILDISEYVGGKILRTIVGILFIALFLLVSTLSIRYLSNSLKVIYFNDSPLIFILLFFLAPAIFINKYGLKAISGVNLIFIPIIILSLVFLLVSVNENASLLRIFPILGDGFFETFIAGSTNIFAFTGLAYLYFMPSLLKDSKHFKSVSIISVVVSALCLIFSIISLIITLPAITSTDEMLSIYLLTRMIEIAQFLERLDAIFIFIWIIALISLLSLTFFYILQIFKRITRIEDSKALNLSLVHHIYSNILLNI